MTIDKEKLKAAAGTLVNSGAMTEEEARLLIGIERNEEPRLATLTLSVDTSLLQEMLPAAEYAVESGAMTVDEAAETLAAFARVSALEEWE